MMDSASYGKGSGDEDSDDDEVGLDADPSVGGGSGGKKRKVKKDPNKPKGATSAYLYYSKGARAAVVGLPLGEMAIDAAKRNWSLPSPRERRDAALAPPHHRSGILFTASSAASPPAWGAAAW